MTRTTRASQIGGVSVYFSGQAGPQPSKSKSGPTSSASSATSSSGSPYSTNELFRHEATTKRQRRLEFNVGASRLYKPRGVAK